MSTPTILETQGNAYLTIAQAAHLLDTDEDTVGKLAHKGEFGAFKQAGEWLIPSERLELLAVEEVAKLLRVNVQTVRRWARDGIHPAVKVGRRYYFSRKTLTGMTVPA